MEKKEDIIKGGEMPRLRDLPDLSEIITGRTPNLDKLSIMNSIPFCYPIDLLNFTDSLKNSIKEKAGLSYKIIKEINEMNRRLNMSLEKEMNEPDIDYKLTEMHVNEEGVYDEIVFDGIRYK